MQNAAWPWRDKSMEFPLTCKCCTFNDGSTVNYIYVALICSSIGMKMTGLWPSTQDGQGPERVGSWRHGHRQDL